MAEALRNEGLIIAFFPVIPRGLVESTDTDDTMHTLADFTRSGLGTAGDTHHTHGDSAEREDENGNTKKEH